MTNQESFVKRPKYDWQRHSDKWEHSQSEAYTHEVTHRVVAFVDHIPHSQYVLATARIIAKKPNLPDLDFNKIERYSFTSVEAAKTFVEKYFEGKK